MISTNEVCSHKVSQLITLSSTLPPAETSEIACNLAIAILNSNRDLAIAHQAKRPQGTLAPEETFDSSSALLHPENLCLKPKAARRFIQIQITDLMQYINIVDEKSIPGTLHSFTQYQKYQDHPIKTVMSTFFAAQATLGMHESLPKDAICYAIAARNLYYNYLELRKGFLAQHRGFDSISDAEYIEIADLLVPDVDEVARRVIDVRESFSEIVFEELTSSALKSVKAAREIILAKRKGDRPGIIAAAKTLFHLIFRDYFHFNVEYKRINENFNSENIASIAQFFSALVKTEEVFKRNPQNCVNAVHRIIAVRNFVLAFHLHVAPTAGRPRDPSIPAASASTVDAGIPVASASTVDARIPVASASTVDARIPAASASTVDARNSTQLSALERVSERTFEDNPVDNPDDSVSTPALLLGDADFAPDPDKLVVDAEVFLGPKTARVAPTSSTAAPQLTASAARRARERAAAARNANKDPLDPGSVAQRSSVREVPAPSSRVVPASLRRLPSAADPDHVVDDDVEPGT